MPASRDPRPVGGEQQQEAGRRVLPPPGGTLRCQGCGRCSVAQCHPGKARSRDGARGSGCRQAPSAALPLSPRLSLHPVPSGQLELHREAGCILPPPPKQRERSCSERDAGGGGEEAGQGGPPGALHPDRHYSYGRAVSDPQRLGCPVPAASPCQSSLAEPSTEPVVMDHVD